MITSDGFCRGLCCIINVCIPFKEIHPHTFFFSFELFLFIAHLMSLFLVCYYWWLQKKKKTCRYILHTFRYWNWKKKSFKKFIVSILDERHYETTVEGETLTSTTFMVIHLFVLFLTHSHYMWSCMRCCIGENKQCYRYMLWMHASL